MAEAHTRFHVAVSNPESEPDCYSASRLFRRTADAIDGLGQVEVDDLVFHKLQNSRGGLPVLHVYYGRPKTSNDRRSRRGRKKLMAAQVDERGKIDAEHRFVCDEAYTQHLLGPEVHSVSVNNPFAETGLYSVSKLLRRTADLLDILDGLLTNDSVEIDDTVLERKQDPAEGPVPSITVHFSRSDDVERQP